jgi:hypothetical protein
MTKYSQILLFLIFFVMSGCAIKEPKEQQSKFILMKTEQIKFADMGFIASFENRVNVQIYASGQAVSALDIFENKICLSAFECMSKQDFYKKIFGVGYPDDTLENIFLGKPIFNGLNLEKSSNGFTQKILQENKYDISYSVVNGDIGFNDKMHNILIKVENR